MEQVRKPKNNQAKSSKSKVKKVQVKQTVTEIVEGADGTEVSSKNILNGAAEVDERTSNDIKDTSFKESKPDEVVCTATEDAGISISKDGSTDIASGIAGNHIVKSPKLDEPVTNELANAVGQLSVAEKKISRSPVVPGHFYKLCSAKPDQDVSFLDSNLEQDVNSYALQADAASRNHIDDDDDVEASAPAEEKHIEDAISPSAPSPLVREDSVGALIFDKSLEELIGEDVDLAEQDEPGDALLPVHEDDWELGANEQPAENLYPKLPDDVEAADVNSSLEPFTQDELSHFYNNVLLEHGDAYIDQFLVESNEEDDHFKTLVLNYYQARQKLIQANQDYANYLEEVETAAKQVFVTEEGKVEAEGYCQDRRKVNTEHYFEVCHYDSQAGTRLSSMLREAQRIASEQVALTGYSSTVSRMHCEQCLVEVTKKHQYHHNRLKKSSINNTSAAQSSILLQLMDESVTKLKQVCNVLFSFARQRRSKDEVNDRFWTDIQKWISLITMNLIQSSDSPSPAGRHFSEEMFVLNHILRSPPGVHGWADGLVQVSGPGYTSNRQEEKTSLDHSIFLLYLALRVPKGRDKFLVQFQNSDLSDILKDKASGGWTMIDDDGDEVESHTLNSCLPLENDLIMTFRQIPLEHLLVHILQLSQGSDGVYHYRSVDLSSEELIVIFATCDLICHILGEGLATFGRPKYKQLVRRIAQAIRNIVLIVSQQWQQYNKLNDPNSTPQTYSMERLQLEYDEFCKRCVARLLSVAKLGIYQFIADLSYHALSRRAAETLYLLMNVPPGVRSEIDTLISSGYTRQEWLDFIKDPDTKLAFEEQLSTMPANEIVYLLTTFANLAQARPTTERHLINTIATDIFKVSFIYSSTRDICSKSGRELLSSVATYHSYVISSLLHFVDEQMETISSIAVYAMSDLPYSLWEPTEDDVSILRTWLLINQVGSTEYKLAQIIIQGLDFDYKKESNSLCLPHSVHRHIAVLLVETCSRIQLQQSGLMMKSIDQVTKVASAVRLASHPLHQQFMTWAWKILLNLKLHQRVQFANKLIRETSDKNFFIPDINTNSAVLPILHAAKEKDPFACYAAVAMTTAGHRMESFLHDGMEYLYCLAENGLVRAVLNCLNCTLPMFYGTNINLGQNERFAQVLNSLLHATDEGLVRGFTNYLLFDASTQDDSITLLTSLIGDHISQADGDDASMGILSYWLQAVLSIQTWYKDVHLRSLVDYIFKAAFILGEKCLLECRTMLYNNYVDMILHHNHNNQGGSSKNVVTSLLHMVTGNNYQEPPSFIATIASNQNIYFKYETLLIETRYEDDCELWHNLMTMLRSDPKLSIDNAVKRTASKLKLTHAPIHLHLTLYRWAHLALCTPHNHPLLPVVWYNFFLRFIYLPSDGKNSFGCRFFDPVNMLPLYNKLRTRLQNSMEFHLGLISSKSLESNVVAKHNMFVKLYQAFKLWIEEPKVHEANLYLPSLPSQYHPGLLACVRTKNLTACKDSVDKPKIKKELQSLVEKWKSLQNSEKQKRRIYKQFSINRQKTVEESQQRITHLLKQFESPLPFPPHIVYGSWSPPMTVDDLAHLHDYDSVIKEIDQDLKQLSGFASQFASIQSKHQHNNREYLSLLPRLYFMKATELDVKIECKSAFSPTHKCAGGARITMRFKQKTMDESMSDKLKANRKLHKTEMESFMHDTASEDLCYTALHIESVIRALQINSDKPTHGENLRRVVVEAGTRLYYLFADLYSEERVACLPTRLLISSSIELLGQIFISRSSDQASHILQQVLTNPQAASLLAPHFAPSSKTGKSPQENAKDYIQMYQKVVKIVSTTKKDDPDVLFVLLTKFDMESWLEDCQPLLSDRVQLMQFVVVGLIGCITKSRNHEKSQSSKDNKLTEQNVLSNAITHKPSHSAVHEIYLSHFRSLLGFHFPDMLIDALHFLLEASRTRDITMETWEALICVSFKNEVKSPSDETPESDTSSNASSLYYSSSMDWNTLQNTLELFTDYFYRHREMNEEITATGLYQPWAPYIPSIAKLLSYLSQTFLVFARRDLLPLLYTETKLTTNLHWNIMEPVFDLYRPWIMPVSGADSKDINWPWRKEDEKLARLVRSSFVDVIKQFCQSDPNKATAYLSLIWENYTKAVLVEDIQVPAYICNAYHSLLKELPLQLFIPDLTALDQMTKLSDGNNKNPVNFLCYLVPKLRWVTMLQMCRSNTYSQDDDVGEVIHEEWNPVAGEILCRLLHLLFALGSNQRNLEAHSGLLRLFAEVESFPWHCISGGQLDYLANLVSDRYSWTSVLFYETTKQHKIDPRCCAVRLLKVVCRLPLVGEEKGTSQLASPLSPSNSAQLDFQSDWVKRHSFVKSAGRLIQKFKSDEKTKTSLTKPLSRFVERTIESIEMTSSCADSSVHLPSLLSALFDFLNIFSTSLQETVFSSLQSVLARKSICSSCVASTAKPSNLQQCQDCVYMCSRALSPVTLLSTLSAIDCTVKYTDYACLLVESTIESYWNTVTYQNNEEAAQISELLTDSWRNLTTALHKPIDNNKEFLKQCLEKGCLLTLYLQILNTVELPGLHSNNRDFHKSDLPMDKRRDSLYELAVLDVQWLSLVTVTRENESKFLLICDHFLSICALLLKVATLAPEQGFTTHTITDTVASLLPIIDQVSVDKVKSGILGSIGIGRQSPLSTEFRLTAKCLSTYIRQWYARSSPETTDAIDNAQKAFDNLKNLSVINKEYNQFHSTVEQVCQILSEDSPDLQDQRTFMSLFVRSYFYDRKYLRHILLI